MNHTVSALWARKNFGEMLNRAFYKGEEILVERKGKLIAKIVPVKEKNLPKKDILSYAGIWNTKDTNIMKKAIFRNASVIRENWERYQNEIGDALEKIAKLPKNKRPLLFR